MSKEKTHNDMQMTCTKCNKKFDGMTKYHCDLDGGHCTTEVTEDKAHKCDEYCVLFDPYEADGIMKRKQCDGKRLEDFKLEGLKKTTNYQTASLEEKNDLYPHMKEIQEPKDEDFNYTCTHCGVLKINHIPTDPTDVEKIVCYNCQRIIEKAKSDTLEETEQQKENDKILDQLYDQYDTDGVIRLLDNPYNEDRFFVNFVWYGGRYLGAECYGYDFIDGELHHFSKPFALTLDWNGSFKIEHCKPITSQSGFKIFNERVHTIVYEMGAEMFREKFKLTDSVFKGEV